MAGTYDQPAEREQLVTAARTSLGDTLRSVVHFTAADHEVLYVRDGAPSIDLRKAIERLVTFERVGFAEAPVRTALSGDVDHGVGPYQFTVRVHEDGFVGRLLVGEDGVLLTTDGMHVAAFEDAVGTIRRLLGD